ncbi:glyoxysomal processing protease glyoxysomal-like, partial [Trifolium medium]|nr:glyoxysomal processing protease glyoxysomal-like [Trifolium medium]
GRPDLISGVRIDIMTEKTNEGSDQGNPCLLEGELLSLVGCLNLLMLFLTM